jgi:hypothetical protein
LRGPGPGAAYVSQHELKETLPCQHCGRKFVPERMKFYIQLCPTALLVIALDGSRCASAEPVTIFQSLTACRLQVLAGTKTSAGGASHGKCSTHGTQVEGAPKLNFGGKHVNMCAIAIARQGDKADKGSTGVIGSALFRVLRDTGPASTHVTTRQARAHRLSLL